MRCGGCSTGVPVSHCHCHWRMHTHSAHPHAWSWWRHGVAKEAMQDLLPAGGLRGSITVWCGAVMHLHGQCVLLQCSSVLPWPADNFACTERVEIAGSDIVVIGSAADPLTAKACADACLLQEQCMHFVLQTDGRCILRAESLVGERGVNGANTAVAVSCVQARYPARIVARSPPPPGAPPPAQGEALPTIPSRHSAQCSIVQCQRGRAA